MSLLLAHFTPAELPGTLAIWIAGIGLGLALSTRGGRAVAASLALIAGLTALGMLADAGGWATSIRISIDAAFLLAAVVLALIWGRRAGKRPLRDP
jgi:hypothetical protein